MQTWEVVARERIRDSIARYTWSGDALRLGELALAFCADGVLEVRGSDPVAGREAIVDFLGGVGATPSAAPRAGVKRIVRHNVANVRFVELTPAAARVESYFTVFTEIGLDHYGRYRDVFVPVGEEWLIRHRFVSTDWRAPTSTMAPADSIRH
ncbi:MAG TPA: nuclear transport factor 2 family protein [Mycobacteriales bacterium]|nr:nuclear transport factor 2 family protein [Mycobacteriales bacterium]